MLPKPMIAVRKPIKLKLQGIFSGSWPHSLKVIKNAPKTDYSTKKPKILHKMTKN
ncbi:hypothetical protein CHY_0675 [Carboxydothermus hydrogenoformans Z-2901]|uniref:Uncharacterized protein n=1 Tax=Carboxydothermus hydrogenoformans (strain ATCC BAA-161 / DSM 6008 / Z-2901) TaxID=246194 RepID=Q3AEA4_CARHZ|nr:hypothetical protein CHY_0675 [Carboxydothermus hydrogenoformans Z-2901]